MHHSSPSQRDVGVTDILYEVEGA